MKSGSSALIGSGGQSAGTSAASSCSQWSRPVSQATSPPVWRTTRHLTSCGQCSSALLTLVLSAVTLPPRGRLVGGDHRARVAVVDAVGERVRGEAGEDDGVDGADAGAGQHGEGGLGDHRQVDDHAVALADAEALEHVGHAADFGVKLAVGDVPGRLGGVVGLPEDGGLVAALGEVAVDAVDRGVEDAVLEPADRDVGPGEGGVLGPGVGGHPVQPLALLGPEGLGVGDGGGVHLPILRRIDMGRGSQSRPRSAPRRVPKSFGHLLRAFCVLFYVRQSGHWVLRCTELERPPKDRARATQKSPQAPCIRNIQLARIEVYC